MSTVFTTLLKKTSQTANQYKIPVTLLQIIFYLHDIYISKFQFMNYLFANLLVG